jgi:DHA1 family tetracycline resistance protein-like MFS transporter
VLSFLMFIFAIPMRGVLDRAGLHIPALGLTGGLVWLYAARILDGITGGNITTAQAYVTDISDPENRAQALGILGAAFGAGFIVGPGVGGLLAGIDPLLPFYVALAITMLTVLLTTITLPESLTPERRAAVVARRTRQTEGRLALIATQPGLPLILAIAFVETMSFASIPPTMSIYAAAVLFPAGTSVSQVAQGVGLLLGAVGVANVLTQFFLLKPVIHRFGERKVVLITLVMMALMMALAPLTASLYVLGAGFAFFAVARAMAQPAEQSLVTRLGDDGVRGQLLGIYQSATSLGFIIAPIWAGWVFQTISPRAVWWVGAAIILPAIALAIKLNVKPGPLATRKIPLADVNAMLQREEAEVNATAD